MNVRNYQWSDFQQIRDIFAKQKLPMECMPEVMLPIVKRGRTKLIENPRFPIKKVVEAPNGKIAMAAFLKITSEPYLLLDHTVENPGWRWEMLQELMEEMSMAARSKGLEDVTCWVPPHLVESFGPRLQAMGFVESPWQSFTRKL